MQSEIKQNISGPRSKDNPAFSRIYVAGDRYPELRVPFLRVDQSPTQTARGLEPNPAIILYETSGAWGDSAPSIREGHPSPRSKWIIDRGDTVETEARIRPESTVPVFPGRRTRRVAAPGANVSQMHHARKGIVFEPISARQPRTTTPNFSCSHFRAIAPAATVGAVRRAEERPPPR